LSAAPPPVPPGPVPPAATPKLATILTAAASVLVAVGAVMTAANGGMTAFYDWTKGTSQTQSQISAMDERLKLVELGLKTDVPAVRAEAVRMAREIEKRIDDAARTGADVHELQARLREMELRIERMDTLLQILNDNRRRK
jgi:TolA-binding protein